MNQMIDSDELVFNKPTKSKALITPEPYYNYVI